MNTQILVVGSDQQQLQSLIADINASHDWFVADTPTSASDKLHRNPSVVLLQLDSVVDDNKLWRDFTISCELSGIPTLLFSLVGSDAGAALTAMPWCNGVLDVTLPKQAQRAYLQLQLQCQQLENQLELAEGRLFEKNMEFKEGLQSAAHIQQTLMPSSFPNLPRLHFASQFIPCQSVGGDIFNVQRLDEDTVMVYMLDVSGHGVSAAMVTVSVFQSLSPHTGKIIKRGHDKPPYYQITEPDHVLEQLDSEYPFERFDKFFTMDYFLINPHSGVVRYANAAHPPALVLRADGSLEQLDAEGTIVGLGGLVPFEQEQLQLSAGDRLFLYTDGIIEHENSAEELFGQQRFAEVLQGQQQQGLDAQCKAVIDALNTFGEGMPFRDDVTLLGIGFGVSGNKG